MQTVESHYTLWSNLKFLLREMKQSAKRSYCMMWLGIPLKVLLPFIGILLPEIVVRAITENGELKNLLFTILLLGGLLVVMGFAEQYVSGIIEAEAPLVSLGLENRLYYKRLECDYENLENKEISGTYQEALRYIRWERRYIARAGENLMLFFSGIFGFLVYLSILRRLPVWLLLVMIVATCVSFVFSDLGDRERMERGSFTGDAVRRIAYLHAISAEPKAGKDIRLYAMKEWFEDRFRLTHKQIRDDYIRLEKKNYLSAAITAAMGILTEVCAYLKLTQMVAAEEITIAEYVLCIGAVLGFSTWVRQIAEQVQKLWMLCSISPCRDRIARSIWISLARVKIRKSIVMGMTDNVSYRCRRIIQSFLSM